MRRFLIAIALSATTLSGCMTAASPGSGIAATADTVILSGERAFGVAEIIYATAADGVGVLVDAGVIHGATATKIRGINTQARALLVKGKATADAADKARIATQLLGLADQLNTLKKGN